MVDKNMAHPVALATGRAYEIKVQGHLEDYWSDWLGGLAISRDAQGNTLLFGVVPDQAALHGILAQIRDLGLPLISITSPSVDEEEQMMSDAKAHAPERHQEIMRS
jgi:hypothetical protein